MPVRAARALRLAGFDARSLLDEVAPEVTRRADRLMPWRWPRAPGSAPTCSTRLSPWALGRSRRRGLDGTGRASARSDARRRSLQDWLAQAGLGDVAPREFVAVMAACWPSSAGSSAGRVRRSAGPRLFIGAFGRLPPLASTGPAAGPAGPRPRRRGPGSSRRSASSPAPLGRSIPQALFDAGRRGPAELQPAFDAAHREWLLSTDFARTARRAQGAAGRPHRRRRLRDPAGRPRARRHRPRPPPRRAGRGPPHRRQGRKDARAKQAGVRFARRFVLVVPAGMALAGIMIGNGRVLQQPHGSARGRRPGAGRRLLGLVGSLPPAARARPRVPQCRPRPSR